VEPERPLSTTDFPCWNSRAILAAIMARFPEVPRHKAANFAERQRGQTVGSNTSKRRFFSGEAKRITIGRSTRTPEKSRSIRLVLIFASCENILSKKRTRFRFLDLFGGLSSDAVDKLKNQRAIASVDIWFWLTSSFISIGDRIQLSSRQNLGFHPV
jgi:hypothetical protein